MTALTVSGRTSTAPRASDAILTLAEPLSDPVPPRPARSGVGEGVSRSGRQYQPFRSSDPGAREPTQPGEPILTSEPHHRTSPLISPRFTTHPLLYQILQFLEIDVGEDEEEDIEDYYSDEKNNEQ